MRINVLGLDNGDGGKGRGEIPVYFWTSLNETEPAIAAETKQYEELGGGVWERMPLCSSLQEYWGTNESTV